MNAATEVRRSFLNKFDSKHWGSLTAKRPRTPSNEKNAVRKATRSVSDPNISRRFSLGGLGVLAVKLLKIHLKHFAKTRGDPIFHRLQLNFVAQ